MTFLQLVNRVLRRLREDSVTDLTATYSKTIADFLSEIHGEVIESHDWSLFNHTIRVPLTASQGEYDLSTLVSGGGDVNNSDTVLTDKSMLLYVENSPVVWWFETAGTTQGQPMIQISWEEYRRLSNQNTAQLGTQPTFFALRKDGTGWTMAVWPIPETTGPEIHMDWWTPEALLDVDTDLDSRVVLVPTRPLILGTLYLALGERGEEIGEPGNVAEARYYSALGAAKESDILNSGRTNRYEFRRD